MKKLLLSLSLGVMAAASASAITPQDLDGKPVLQMFWGNYYQISGPTLSVAGTFSYENGQLYINRFRGHFKLPVTLSNNKLTIPLRSSFNGDNASFKSGVLAPVQGKHLDNTYGNPLTLVNGYHATCYQVQNYSSASTTAYSTNPYAQVGLPNFVLDKGSIPMSFALELNGSDQNFAIYSKMAFYVMDTFNAHATDSEGQSYDLRVNLLEDNKISFPNLYNQGVRYSYIKTGSLSYDYVLNWIEGTYDHTDNESGTIRIGSQYSGGVVSCGYYGYGTSYSGSYNYGYWTGYWYSSEGQAMNHQRLASNLVETSSENQFSPISGSFNVDNVYHDTPSHQWVHHDGGALHTYEDWSIDIDKSVFYNQAATTVSGRYGVELQWDWTKIKAEKLDVTHHCEVADFQSGVGTRGDGSTDKYIYVRGNVNQLNHGHHVDADHYEFYIVPGTYNKPSTADFNHANGHKNGLNISEFVTDFYPEIVTSRSAENAGNLNEGTKFNLLVPEKELTNAGITPDPNGNYTLYVKAKYATPGLDDTFHALTPFNNTVTDIESAIAESGISIKAVSGGVEVEGAENVEIFTVGGSQVYQGASGTIDLPSALYIVRADGKVEKVNVK